jgi:phosphatidylserine/phosphatidylglycerophosphate/cardiolipin synthase-like enzyme/regulation of enolase protein 1 (concanavalin A-like superfamily)
MARVQRVIALALLLLAGNAVRAAAQSQDTLCDASFQDCRAPLIQLIRQETVGIDVAFWFMEDSRYSAEIIRRWQAGVPVRVIIDQRAFPDHPVDQPIVQSLVSAGIPIRQRSLSNSYILHWKTMIFDGQGTVEFSGANYSPVAFVPQAPYSDYEDEAIYFTTDPSIVNSFRTKYDDLWIDTTNYADYANIAVTPARRYGIFTKDPELNFPQQEGYASRLLARYPKETQGLDVIMFRITDERETDAVISTFQRGIPVRIYSDTDEYREPSRQWVSYNMDKLWAAGIPFKVRAHLGLNHQKLVLFRSQEMAVFGSSNWTSPSDKGQQEHNMFSTRPWIYQWFSDQFERKWNNLAPNGSMETDWFQPLAPDRPVLQFPADASTGQSISMALRWDGGYYAHYYDVYFGTDPNPPLYAANLHLGPTIYGSEATPSGRLVLPLLQHGTTYYWRVVSKTMAGLTRNSTSTFSFTTNGTAPPPPLPVPGASTIVMWAATNVAAGNIAGNWQFNNDATAAGGKSLWNPDRSTARISPPLPAPTTYFETTFTAVAGTPYHLWLRLKAQNNSTINNSVSVQFDDAIDSFGTPLYRIGTGQGAEVVLQDPSGTLSGWGWDDNGFNGEATLIYFATTGTHRLRIQQRTDGAMVDQIVLSPDAFITTTPGAARNDATIYGSTLDGATPPSSSGTQEAPPSLLPAGWQRQDIGAVGMPGYAEIDSNSVFSVAGGGADVWGAADALHYTYTDLNGDGSIVARVASVQNTNAWVKAGVMIRDTTSPGSAQAFMLLSYSKGTAFQRRVAAGGTSTSTTGTTTSRAPYWVRLDRAGNIFTAYQSADGVTWRLVGSDTIPMAASALVGLGVSSHTTDAVALVTFDRITLNGAPVVGPCVYSISPASLGVGADATSAIVSVGAGATCNWTATSNAPWMAVASGAAGTGNGSVAINVAANPGEARSGTLTIAGQTFTMSQAAVPTVPCDYTLSSSAQSVTADASTLIVTLTTASNCGWTATSNASWLTVTGGGSGTGSGTISIAVSANTAAARTGTVTIAGQTFAVSQAAALPLPYGWSHQDVGNVGVAGSAVVNSATAVYTVKGAGADVWGAADAFHYAYRPLSGDGRIVARVATVSSTNAWVKAGVMIRETLDPASAQAFMLESYSKGLAFQRRPISGGTSVSSAGASTPAPYWVRLDRAGNLFSAYQSTDGTTWTLVGTETIPMAADVFIGLAVSSHTTGAAATATFDNVTVTPPLNAPCSYTLSPNAQAIAAVGGGASVAVATGSTCDWTAASNDPWITVTGGAAGTGNGVVSVSVEGNAGDARSGSATIGGQTFTISQAAAGCTYSIAPASVSIAADGSSTMVTISVRSGCAWTATANVPWLSVTSPASGTGNGNVVIAASANTGAARSGTATVAGQTFTVSQGAPPCSYAILPASQWFAAGGGTATVTISTAATCNWTATSNDASWLTTSAASGTGSSTVVLTAVANAGDGRTTTVSVAGQTLTASQVSSNGFPAGWSHQDVGAVGAAGSASFNTATATFVVKGAGADIWGTADAFHYLYRPMTGDGAIVARVASIQNVAAWVKAGVMIRETLDPGSAQALMLVSASKGLAFQRRTATGGISTSTAGAVATAPYWVKIERAGATINAYASTDGASWTLVGSDTFTMGPSVYVGLAVSSHTTSTAAQATFDHVVGP